MASHAVSRATSHRAGRTPSHKSSREGQPPGADIGDGSARPAWKTWGLRALTLAFFVLVAAVIARMASTMDWDTVLATLAGYRAGTLALAVAWMAGSYGLYAAFELVARRYSGHRLPVPLTALVGAIAYSFNMNLGAWLGGIGFRYRLYSELGVETATTARIYLSALLSNWSGYLALAGAVFAFHRLELPPQWDLNTSGLHAIGALLLAVALAFLLLCAFARKRHVTIRGHEIDLPSLPMALLQMTLGAANWMVMAAIVYTLMPQAHGELGYATVLAVLLIACIAGVAVHIPGGLGVIEAVFIALLGHRVPESQLLGALLAYRAVYYVGPLIMAGLAYATLEAGIKRRASQAATPTSA